MNLASMLDDQERRAWTTPVLIFLILLLMTALSSFAAPAFQRTVTEMLVMLTVVTGLQIFVGNSGIFSFGHVGFMSAGAYVSAILTIAPAKKAATLALPPFLAGLQLPWPAAMAVAVAVTGLLALVLLLPLVRLRGIAFPMATFALLVIEHVIAMNWTGVTGGRQALVGLPRYTNLWTALAVAGLALLVATWYSQLRQGLALRCSRENEVAAAATGIDIGRERLFAFVISAMVCAAGGVLFAHFVGTMTAGTFYLEMTFVTLAMLVVGGMRGLTGACIGVVLVSVVSELFRSLERGVDLAGLTVKAAPGLQEIILSIVLLAILITRPNGLAGDWELTSSMLRTRKRKET